ncbi:uncharacterized protein [Rutidosis leptorrhynchoides]|uniref:uncharacterized protein n=1 Tax=Rutidosis leptorrhynchoides TaxID=125765 RepID=UPI003A9A0A6D
MVASLGNISISNTNDSWQWELDNEVEYTVCATKYFVDDILLPTNVTATRWNKCIPRKIRKINVFLWRVALDRLPTRDNLSKREIEVVNGGCAICPWGTETLQHVLFGCDLALDLWRKCRVWIGLQMPMFSTWTDYFDWFDGWIAKEATKNRVYSIVAALLWLLWRFRNSVVFPGDVLQKSCLFDSI